MSRGDYDFQRIFWSGNDDDTGLVDHVWAEALRAAAKHGWERTPADVDLDEGAKLAILVEEVGEVARALTYDEGSDAKLYDELIQVATMALMWAGSLRA